MYSLQQSYNSPTLSNSIHNLSHPFLSVDDISRSFQYESERRYWGHLPSKLRNQKTPMFASIEQQQQSFYDPLSRTNWVSRYQKKHSPTHHPDHHPFFIGFFHLLRAVASSLFKLHAWQSFCTTYWLYNIARLLQLLQKYHNYLPLLHYWETVTANYQYAGWARL